MRSIATGLVILSVAWAGSAWGQEAEKQTIRADGVKGTQIRTLSPVPIGSTRAFEVPLLDEFWFRFTEDHHLHVISTQPQHPSANKLQVSFKDDGESFFGFGGGEKKYSYQTSVVWRQFPGATRGVAERVGCTRNPESCAVRLDRPRPDDVFVLVGFQVNYHGKDHHVQGLSIREDGGVLRVRLLDDEDRTYNFEVDYVWVPAAQVVATGTATGAGPMEGLAGVRAAIPAGTSVIRGFALAYQGGARHVREILVATPSERSAVEAALNDGGRDPFQYEVRWALVRQGGPIVDPNPGG